MQSEFYVVRREVTWSHEDGGSGDMICAIIEAGEWRNKASNMHMDKARNEVDLKAGHHGTDDSRVESSHDAAGSLRKGNAAEKVGRK